MGCKVNDADNEFLCNDIQIHPLMTYPGYLMDPDDLPKSDCASPTSVSWHWPNTLNWYTQ